MAIIKPFICGRNRLSIPSICGDSGYFVGVKNMTVTQGTDVDLAEGVKAYNKDSVEVSFSVTPSDFNPCEIGRQEFVYEAEDVSVTRVITVTSVPNPTIYGIESKVVGVNEVINTLNGVSAKDGNGNNIAVTCTEGAQYTPTEEGTIYLHYSAVDSCGNRMDATRTINVIDGHFTGIEDATVTQGADFNLLNGVTATDWMGNTVPFSVTPDEFVPCQTGEQEFTYSAVGVSDTVRTITVEQAADPTINGATEALGVAVGEEFDPLDGVTAVDANGNPIADVTVVLVS